MVNNVGNYAVPNTLSQLKQNIPLEDNLSVLKNNSPTKILDSFSVILAKQINETNQYKKDSETAQKTFATGGNVSLHDVMIKAEKAEMSMQLTLQLRNKLIAAYKEIQNIRV